MLLHSARNVITKVASFLMQVHVDATLLLPLMTFNQSYVRDLYIKQLF